MKPYRHTPVLCQNTSISSVLDDERVYERICFRWTHLSVRSDDAEFLWRLARASRDLTSLSSISADEKKRLTYEALDYAKKALEKDEASFAAHKVGDHFCLLMCFAVFEQVCDVLSPSRLQWFAICLSDVGDYEGIKVKLGNSYIIRNHLEVRC